MSHLGTGGLAWVGRVVVRAMWDAGVEWVLLHCGGGGSWLVPAVVSVTTAPGARSTWWDVSDEGDRNAEVVDRECSDRDRGRRGAEAYVPPGRVRAEREVVRVAVGAQQIVGQQLELAQSVLYE